MLDDDPSQLDSNTLATIMFEAGNWLANDRLAIDTSIAPSIAMKAFADAEPTWRRLAVGMAVAMRNPKAGRETIQPLADLISRRLQQEFPLDMNMKPAEPGLPPST
jgi:hypothetical protein